MASRDDILRAVRASQPPAAKLPGLVQEWISYPDRRRQFAELVESVGGRCVFVDDVDGVNRELASLSAYTTAKRIVSLVSGAGAPNVDLEAVDDPHALADVDFAILPGRFGVAENGAVWVTDEGVPHRAVYFLVQHLALVLPAGEIVDNLHQAYERLAFDGPGFGVFISGPSKTADIEQSLVIGAHGPRSLTVFCVGRSEPEAYAKS
jgi:L-lactate dehydrogenase complex protein LldG